MTAPPALHRRARRIATASLIALAACASGRDGRHAPAAMEHAEPERARDAGAPAPGTPAPGTPADDASHLSEAAGRALLAERFRAAGFRVRYDVPVAREGAFALTVDGYDPARRVGFEYVAAAERDTDLDAAERAALAHERPQRILIVDAADAGGLDAEATRFLRAAQAPP
jgi:hypothetical protein